MPDLHETINQFLEGSIANIKRDPVIESKSITANGTYTAPEGVDGYSPITVNVPTPTPVIESKSITANGTYTAPEGVDGYSPITVNVPLPQNAYLLKSVANLPQAIASFNDGADAPLKELKVAVTPYQDLHGYDAPWAGGAGENKLQNTATTQTIGGVTYTVNADGTISLSGTASGSYSQIVISSVTLPVGTYKLSDALPLNVNYELYIAGVSGASTKYDKDKEFTITEEATNKTVFFYITGGQNVNGLTLKPMIRLASVTDATFVPYSNICPISGWDEVDVTVADDVENPTVSNVYTIDLDGTRYGGEVDVVSGIGREYKEYPSYNGETLIGPWISDRDEYAEGTTPTIGAQVVDKGDISTFNTIPTAVKSLRGVNNVYANTGDIKDAEYFSKEG